MSKERNWQPIDKVIEELDKKLDIDPVSFGRHSYTKNYLYKLISQKKLSRKGPRHMTMLDLDEVFQRLVR